LIPLPDVTSLDFGTPLFTTTSSVAVLGTSRGRRGDDATRPGLQLRTPALLMPACRRTCAWSRAARPTASASSGINGSASRCSIQLSRTLTSIAAVHPPETAGNGASDEPPLRRSSPRRPALADCRVRRKDGYPAVIRL